MKRERQSLSLKPMKNATESVQIRVHGVDGSIQMFTQHDDSLIRQTLDWFQPGCIFAQKRIEIPGEHSLTTFFVPKVTRIDLVAEPRSNWNLPTDLVEAVELTERAFWALAKSQQSQEVQRAPSPPDNTAMVLLDIALTGGQHVFLAQEAVVPRPSQDMQGFGTFLTTTSFPFLMRTGGVASLNVANLVCFTAYPDPAQVSADVWAVVRQRNSTEPGGPQRRSGLPQIGEREAA